MTLEALVFVLFGPRKHMRHVNAETAVYWPSAYQEVMFKVRKVQSWPTLGLPVWVRHWTMRVANSDNSEEIG